MSALGPRPSGGYQLLATRATATLDVKDVAEILAVSVSTVHALIKAGKLPFRRNRGWDSARLREGQLVFDPADVEQLRAERALNRRGSRVSWASPWQPPATISQTAGASSPEATVRGPAPAPCVATPHLDSMERSVLSDMHCLGGGWASGRRVLSLITELRRLHAIHALTTGPGHRRQALRPTSDEL